MRNWDYRYCWLRDATFTLYALLVARLHRRGERLARLAAARRRRRAGGPADHVRRRRRAPAARARARLAPGYERLAAGARRQRGAEQFQLDVYGEVMDALHLARGAGLRARRRMPGRSSARCSTSRDGLARSPTTASGRCAARARHFTHSKVMAWVAFDRAVKAVERVRAATARSTAGAPARRDPRARSARGLRRERGSFTQSYGARRARREPAADPLVGFLPPDDPRVRGTVEASERELMRRRLRAALPHRARRRRRSAAGEGTFLPCTFWLADNLALTGATTRRGELFERLLELRNDVGLLSEEYDPRTRRCWATSRRRSRTSRWSTRRWLLSMPAHSLSERCLHGDRPATVRGDEHPAQTTAGAGPKAIG